jgi:hypothetical protein
MTSPTTEPFELYTILDFKFVGGAVRDVKIAYRSFNRGASKGTVLIPTCFSGRIDKTRNFTSGALKDYHVIVVAMLGNGESSSPSNDINFPSDYSLRYEVSRSNTNDPISPGSWFGASRVWNRAKFGQIYRIVSIRSMPFSHNTSVFGVSRP